MQSIITKLLLSTLTKTVLKRVVVAVLKDLASRTDNQLDDKIVVIVADALDVQEK